MKHHRKNISHECSTTHKLNCHREIEKVKLTAEEAQDTKNPWPAVAKAMIKEGLVQQYVLHYQYRGKRPTMGNISKTTDENMTKKEQRDSELKLYRNLLLSVKIPIPPIRA